MIESGHAFSKYFLKNSRNYHAHEQFDARSVAVFDIIIWFATNSSLSHALEYRDSRAQPIQFQFLPCFIIVARSHWIANNAGWHQ